MLTRTRLIIAMLAVTALVAVVGIAITTTASAANVTELEPAGSATVAHPIQLPAGLTAQRLADAYAAFSHIERAAEDGANAVNDLQKGQVSNVDLTADQLAALLDEGKGAAARVIAGVADLLAIVGITPAQLSAWEANLLQIQKPL